MKTAIIDLGTNTFNLLIVDIQRSFKYEIIYKSKFAVKIGQGGMLKGELQPEPIQRGKEAITDHLRVITEYDCDKVFAFATSAIRSSSNGRQFVKDVQDELGLKINVIDGDEEAQLIYEGVNLAINFTNNPSLIMDIGGGSTEFIIADSDGVLWKKSYNLGVSRILQMLEPNDPLSDADVDKLNQLLSTELQELILECKGHNVRELIGSSGSFDSFIEMIWAGKGILKTTKDVITENFNIEELQQLNAKLIKTNALQREQIPGLVQMRVDTIHLASLMVQWTLRECKLEEPLLSTYALKEGVLHRIMENRL